MKAVIQRVNEASVEINGKVHSAIKKGMLILFCVEKDDTIDSLEWIANKILGLRFFEDNDGRMNKSIKDINGEILVVSQFTLAADCKKGTRPSFDQAEKTEKAKLMYEKFVEKLSESQLPIKTGIFAAHMDIKLINDGPVTFVLEK